MFTKWNGEPLAGLQIALQVNDPEQHDSPVASAFDGTRGVLLPVPLVGVFLIDHSDRQFIVHGAARVFWRLHSVLSSPLQSEAIATLWCLARQFQLLDIRLLDQRIRLILERCHPKPKPLADLVRRYVEQTPERTRRQRVQNAGDIEREVEEIFQVYCAMNTNDRYASHFFDPAKSQQGPMGVGIDVQGAIAINQPNADLAVDHASQRQILERCEEIYAEACQELNEDHLAHNCFYWEGHIIARDQSGHPKRKTGLLRDRLGEWLNLMRDSNGRLFLHPRDDQGRISLVPDHWAPFTECHAQLKAWAAMTDSAALQRYFRFGNQGRGRVDYDLVPFLRSRVPSLQAMKRWILPQIQLAAPQPLRVTLVDLELRCLAATIEKHSSESALRHLLQDQSELGGGDDFREVLAAEIHDQVLCGELSNTSLPAVDRERLRVVVDILLFALPRGLASVEVRMMLAGQGIEIGENEYKEIERIIKNKLGGMSYFLKDRTIEDVCDEFKIDPDELFKKLDAREMIVDTADAAMRNFVYGDDNPKIREALVALLPADSKYKALLEENENQLNPSLLVVIPETSPGRLGMPALGTQALSHEFLQLKDDVIKQVAFALVADGVQLIAVEEDGFIVHADGADINVSEHIKSVVLSTLDGIIPDFPFRCSIETSGN